MSPTYEIASLRSRLAATVVIVATTAVTPLALGDDSIMCRNSLVTLGMTAEEVLAKCGAPKEKTVTEVPVRAPGANGARPVVGTRSVEQWTIDRGYGRPPAILTFAEGKLESIEIAPR
jgi:hypothetical protein